MKKLKEDELNILNIDSQIKEKFKEKNDNLREYKDRCLELRRTLKLDLSVRLMVDVKKNIKDIMDKIRDIELRHDENFYIAESSPYLEKYKKILKTPQKVSFIGKRSDADKEKRQIIKEYIKIARKYSDVEIEISNKNEKVVCNNCENTKKFDIIDNSIYICQECGAQQEIMLHTSSYKDIDRVNISTKYTYDRKVHFRDCMNQYQGRQNSTIDDKVYIDLEEQFRRHHLLVGNKSTNREERFKKITKEHIHIFLKDLGYTKHYENINLIHYNMTGKKPDDISHLEDKLLEDFEILSNAYHKIFKNRQEFERKNFINTQYVLYQLLLKHGHKCNKQDFTILKTIDRKFFHDKVCREVFLYVGWSFNPLY